MSGLQSWEVENISAEEDASLKTGKTSAVAAKKQPPNVNERQQMQQQQYAQEQRQEQKEQQTDQLERYFLQQEQQ